MPRSELQPTSEPWISRGGYEFDPASDQWRLSRDVTLSLKWTYAFLGEPLLSGFRWALARYAREYAAGSTSRISWNFKLLVEHACHVCESDAVLHHITPAAVLSYRSSLGSSKEHHLGGLVAFFKRWVAWEEPGLGEEVTRIFRGMRLRGMKKGVAVALCDPHKGPLSELEYEALHLALVDGFESGELALPDYALALLLLVTGRRPSQIGDLRCGDLVEAVTAEGATVYVLNVPRKKQKGKNLREEFRPVALTVENGAVVKALINEVQRIWLKLGGNPSASRHLPIFPKWLVLRASVIVHDAEEQLRVAKNTDIFHIPRVLISNRLTKLVKKLKIQSERTGSALHVFPLRLRRTLGTRIARETGYGTVPIAEALDHSDTQHVKVYTENVPESVDAINAALAFQLAPLAQAFAGMIVDDESEAIRGDDLTSRVRTGDGKGAGTCGHYGFCGALAPIACYTCKAFQPWLDGPHEEVLNSLLSKREQVAEQTKDEVIAATNDRTIIAVAEVIKLCDQRRKELRENG